MPSEVTSKKGIWRPYLLGLFLSYVFCGVMFGRGFVAGASWSIGIAAMTALVFWPLVAPSYLAVQLLLSFATSRFWEWGKRQQMLVLNAPITALIVLATIYSCAQALREPQLAFKFFVQDPIPSGVKINQFGRSQGIGESLKLGLVFEMNEDDLGGVLRAGGYDHTYEMTSLDADYIGLKAKGSCGIGFNDQVSRVLYVSTNDAGKRLLVRTNHPEVIFYYEKPNP